MRGGGSGRASEQVKHLIAVILHVLLLLPGALREGTCKLSQQRASGTVNAMDDPQQGLQPQDWSVHCLQTLLTELSISTGHIMSDHTASQGALQQMCRQAAQEHRGRHLLDMHTKRQYVSSVCCCVPASCVHMVVITW